MRRIILLLWLATLIIVVTSCRPPVGAITGNGGGGNGGGDTIHGEDLWVVPHRIFYNINGVFWRDTDLRVFVSRQGTLHPIHIDNVAINVIENPAIPNVRNLVPIDEGYMFTTEGRKVIAVSYNDLSSNYSVEVQDPWGIGGGNGDDSGDGINVGGGGGTNIVWDYPRIVAFNANRGTGTLPPLERLPHGTTITIPGQGNLTRLGYNFIGWSTSTTGSGIIYTEGDTFIIRNDTTFYARWEFIQ